VRAGAVCAADAASTLTPGTCLFCAPARVICRYRAPECLLTDGFYGPEMDVWGVACVIFEISSLFPLFPGTDERDQIKRIHTVVGSPPSGLLARLKAHANSHIDFSSFAFDKGTGLASLAPNIDASLIDLLTRMLAYDPKARFTAEQCLAHAFFDELRAVPLPTPAPAPVPATSGSAAAIASGAPPAAPAATSSGTAAAAPPASKTRQPQLQPPQGGKEEASSDAVSPAPAAAPKAAPSPTSPTAAASSQPSLHGKSAVSSGSSVVSSGAAAAKAALPAAAAAATERRLSGAGKQAAAVPAGTGGGKAGSAVSLPAEPAAAAVPARDRRVTAVAATTAASDASSPATGAAATVPVLKRKDTVLSVASSSGPGAVANAAAAATGPAAPPAPLLKRKDTMKSVASSGGAAPPASGPAGDSLRLTVTSFTGAGAAKHSAAAAPVPAVASTFGGPSLSGTLRMARQQQQAGGSATGPGNGMDGLAGLSGTAVVARPPAAKAEEGVPGTGSPLKPAALRRAVLRQVGPTSSHASALAATAKELESALSSVVEDGTGGQQRHGGGTGALRGHAHRTADIVAGARQTVSTKSPSGDGAATSTVALEPRPPAGPSRDTAPPPVRGPLAKLQPLVGAGGTAATAAPAVSQAGPGGSGPPAASDRGVAQREAARLHVLQSLKSTPDKVLLQVATAGGGSSAVRLGKLQSPAGAGSEGREETAPAATAPSHVSGKPRLGGLVLAPKAAAAVATSAGTARAAEVGVGGEAAGSNNKQLPTLRPLKGGPAPVVSLTTAAREPLQAPQN